MAADRPRPRDVADPAGCSSSQSRGPAGATDGRPGRTMMALSVLPPGSRARPMCCFTARAALRPSAACISPPLTASTSPTGVTAGPCRCATRRGRACGAPGRYAVDKGPVSPDDAVTRPAGKPGDRCVGANAVASTMGRPIPWRRRSATLVPALLRRGRHHPLLLACGSARSE